MAEELSKSSARPLRAIKKKPEEGSTLVAVTNLVEVLGAAEPGEITPSLMELLEGLKRKMSKEQFEEILDDLLFTVALLKKGA
jgi:hypothetical protein